MNALLSPITAKRYGCGATHAALRTTILRGGHQQHTGQRSGLLRGGRSVRASRRTIQDQRAQLAPERFASQLSDRGAHKGTAPDDRLIFASQQQVDGHDRDDTGAFSGQQAEKASAQHTVQAQHTWHAEPVMSASNEPTC